MASAPSAWFRPCCRTWVNSGNFLSEFRDFIRFAQQLTAQWAWQLLLAAIIYLPKGKLAFSFPKIAEQQGVQFGGRKYRDGFTFDGQQF